VQFSRQDTGSANCALLGTMAYSEDTHAADPAR
jgi:hypothetical protein